ncbi:hypothetical protein J6590_058880 [Homalodisca vitripennis]|nr:hypothetical protein J6590_058880 [Homalodisca vitripennis]
MRTESSGVAHSPNDRAHLAGHWVISKQCVRRYVAATLRLAMQVPLSVAVAVAAVAVTLTIGVRASEFPERECCDPVYPLPAVSASVTPDPPSSVSASSAVTQETHTGQSTVHTIPGSQGPRPHSILSLALCGTCRSPCTSLTLVRRLLE